LTAQIAGHAVVYSVILRHAVHQFNREGVERHFDYECPPTSDPRVAAVRERARSAIRRGCGSKGSTTHRVGRSRERRRGEGGRLSKSFSKSTNAPRVLIITQIPVHYQSHGTASVCDWCAGGDPPVPRNASRALSAGRRESAARRPEIQPTPK